MLDEMHTKSSSFTTSVPWPACWLQRIIPLTAAALHGPSQGEVPPPLSPILANGSALMEAHLRPTGEGARSSTSSLDGAAYAAGGDVGPSRPMSESGDLAREGHKKGRFKVRKRCPLSLLEHTPDNHSLKCTVMGSCSASEQEY